MSVAIISGSWCVHKLHNGLKASLCRCEPSEVVTEGRACVVHGVSNYVHSAILNALHQDMTRIALFSSLNFSPNLLARFLVHCDRIRRARACAVKTSVAGDGVKFYDVMTHTTGRVVTSNT